MILNKPTIFRKDPNDKVVPFHLHLTWHECFCSMKPPGGFDLAKICFDFGALLSVDTNLEPVGPRLLAALLF